MHNIKNKCLRAVARFRNSGFARKGVLALGALTIAVGDAMAASKGAAGFTKATQEVSSYQTPVSNLMKAIAAVIVLVGLKIIQGFPAGRKIEQWELKCRFSENSKYTMASRV